MSRGLLAAAILTAWVGTLAWNGARQFGSRDASARELVRQRVGPGAATYRLERDGTTTGLLLRSVDTLPGQVYIIERWDVMLDATRRAIVVDEAWLTRDLVLQRFVTERSGDGVVPMRLEGRVDGGLLTWQAVRDGAAFDDTLRAARPWTVPAALPLLAALATPDARAAGYRLFEPLAFRQDDAVPTRLRDSTWIVADSATLDSAVTPPRFRAVTYDTLAATLVSWRGAEGRAAFWVDRTGLPLRVAGLFGTTGTRTADELARQDYRPRTRAATGPTR